MNCRLNYMYRDGSNYKQRGAVVLGNPDGLELVAAQAGIRAACSSGDGFNAAQVGLPELFFEDGIDDDDHAWHEFVSLEGTDDPVTDGRSLRELVSGFESACRDGWRIDAERLGGWGDSPLTAR